MAETGLQVVEKLNTSTNGEIVAAKKRQMSLHGIEHRPVSFVTEKEVNAMAYAARSDRDKLLILTLFQCCLRASEAVQLTPKHRIPIEGRPVWLSWVKARSCGWCPCPRL